MFPFEKGKLDEFRRELALGKYTSVGSYPKFFVTADGEALSFESATENKRLIERATRLPGTDEQWRVVGVEVNWENASLFCADSGERIESAYAEEGAGE